MKQKESIIVFFSGYCQIDFAESSSSSSPDPFFLGSKNDKSIVVS
jgi:hypothetical protein